MYTKEDLSKRRSQLSPAQRALLEKQLRGEVTTQNQPTRALIPRRPEGVAIPLSFAQERLLFLQQIDPDNPAFNEHRAILISGSLNLTALNQMARELYRRHELLRTSFRFIDGQLSQVVDPELHLHLIIPEVDISHLPTNEREAEAWRLAIVESQQPFDLNQGPMLRLIRVKLDDLNHLLLLSMHHIIYDGWSNQVLLNEIKSLYQAFDEGQPSPLPELPIQYGDFAYWQRQWLQGNVLSAQIDYWRTQLSGTLPILELPTDRPRPSVQNFQGASETLCISEELTAALKLIGQQEGATLFMTLLAAFKTLLLYYTRQTDFIVGTYIAGRNKPELERLIGFFVNSLPLRTDLSGDPTFAELLQYVRKVTLGAYNHQDVPFEKLIEVFLPKRDMSRTPLCQAMFVLLNVPKPVETEGRNGLSMRDWMLVEDTFNADAQCDITLTVDEFPDGLRGSLVYDTMLFNASTMKRMLTHFHTLLEHISAGTHQRLSDLSFITDSERQQILGEWNATSEPFDEALGVHQLFEAQVKQTSDATALSHGDHSLSYQQLNQRANRLADYLRVQGVGPEICVGLCIERSVELIVGLLGILKSGGTYVPLDPAYPPDRLNFIMQDTRMPLVLTMQGLVERLPSHAVRFIRLDRDWPEIAGVDSRNPFALVDPANIAYIIYTSGSTGTPKGVAIQHRSLVNFTQSTCAAYMIQPGDRALQFASSSFDASVEEIYPTLIGGATLVLRTDAMLISAPVFLKTCQDWGITILNLPTSYWHSLSEAPVAESFLWPACLRLVIIGGERALPEYWSTWNRLLHNKCRLVNTYGPTEATVVATRYQEDQLPEGAQASGEVPIGHPVTNTHAYILDRSLKLVPAGVPGEIYLGGVALARGYIERPELTAERFVPNPFADFGLADGENSIQNPKSKTQNGERLYRTGDRGRYLPDGAIEFLGRTDDQVKIRGFRIQLGEIEAALRRCPAVQAGVVLAREDDLGDRRLVAYVVVENQEELVVSELQKSLREQLPEYMIPSAFVLLPALPLTSSGKIDRQALPAPDTNRPKLPTPYVAPSTLIEKELVGIWSEVLKRDGIGVQDNFFELGGHSLLVTQVIYRINNAFEIDLPLRSLFEELTIADLALHVEEVLLDMIEQLDDEEV